MSVYKLIWGAVAAIAAMQAHAQGTVWKCTDDDGRSHYTNVQSDAKGKNCTVVTREISVIPTPNRPAAAPRAAATPAGFPKVDPDAQKARDDNRRKILEDELANEQKALGEARAKLTEQEGIREGGERNYQKVLDRLQPFKDEVEDHERNIEALQKEIGGLK